MKHTYIKLLLRSVKKTRARFLSIMAIVAVGVCFLSGLMATSPDMELTVDTQYDETNFFDINIKGSLGLTDDDISALEELDYVETVMPASVTDVVMSTDTGDYVTRIYGVPLDWYDGDSFINKFELVEGRMPENETECLIASPNGYSGDIHEPGEVYIISEDNKDYEDRADTYAFDGLTVVGIVTTPYYMSVESEPSTVGTGTIGLVMFIYPECYSLDAYTDVFLTVEGAREMDSFSDEYERFIEDIQKKLEDFGIGRGEIRTSQVRNEAQEALDEARAEYEDAEAEAEEKLADARQELDDGWVELENGKTELEESKQALTNSQAEVDNAVNALINEVAAQKSGLYARIEAAAQPMYDAALAEIEAQEQAGREQIAAGQAQVDAQRAALEEQERQLLEAEEAGYPVSDEDKSAIQAGKARLDAAQAEIDAQTAALEQQIAAAKAQLDEGFRAEINNQYNNALVTIDTAASQGWTEIGAAQSQIDEGWKQVAEGEQEITDSEAELVSAEEAYEEAKAEAEAELSDARAEIDDAQKQIGDIEDAQWYIFGREDTVSFSGYKANIEKVEAIAQVFPVFFFLVAALVALTTMTRMVEEERTQIGTLKALGYSNGSIMFYYIGYSVLASLAGAAVGLAVGFKTLPAVIANAYSMMYTLPKTMIPFRWDYAFVIAPLGVGCTTAATLAACLSQLREKPSTLMLPRAPKAGKRVLLERIGFIWKRMSFTWKVTVRNIFRYKKRLFMTVFGVAGCCALLVTGFGLRDSIQDIVRLQFDEIYKYNLSLYLKEDDSARAPAVRDFLADSAQVEGSVLVHTESVTVETSSGFEKTNLLVPQDRKKLLEQITLRQRTGREEIQFNEDGVILTEKLCETLKISVGDTITLKDSDGKAAQLTVTGITESYVASTVYISAEMYQEKYGAPPEYRMALVKVSDESAEARDRISQSLLTGDDVLMVQFSESIRESFANTVSSINYIVIVLIVAAGLLAVVVLYNLTNINICERQKELATIRVLGFHDSELAAYIYRETTVLCILGILAGFVLGIWLHAFVIQTAEVNAVMFGRDIYPASYAYSALVTLAFTVIVDVIMLKKLRGIDMVESMKANE